MQMLQTRREFTYSLEAEAGQATVCLCPVKLGI